ncbi:hypothetical protein GCM10017083_29820 [Thalassobaculum fulvum]|uniref:histidine kinase n=1 Tax=Thalassobaculum fulvum TaxID=1633335 RepID=A0A918XSY6_9PROT|nr:MASE3 domain-containing protein [Thalassobaculum fulvum]GHD53306.1 hypothetical protein GCM10017083_29820 [Thalassobaculum fulvum]
MAFGSPASDEPPSSGPPNQGWGAATVGDASRSRPAALGSRLAADPLANPRLWGFPIALTGILLVIAYFDFLTFHTLAEFFAISVALVMFSFSWYTSDFSRNRFLLFLASGYFWVAVLDLAHALTYKGLAILPYTGTNATSQFWIVTRYFESVLLLLAPILAGRALRKEWLFAANGVIAVGLGAWVVSGHMPDTYVEGTGLTPFKIYSEYVIIAVLIAAVVALLTYRRTLLDREEATILIASVLLTIAAELAFTVYDDPYGLANLVGHVFKLFSFWMIFQAIVASSLRRPYLDLQDALEVARESRRSAEQANQAKSDFLSMMSHDLRTPLNAIIGFSDMMRHETLGPLGNPKYAEYTEAIRKSGAQLVDLINDILDVSKIESGSYELDEELIELRPLLSEICLGYDRDTPLGRHAIRLDIPADAPRLRAERRALSQIATNLIGNSAKFSEPGSEIVVSWGPRGDGRWALGVRDRGRGIPADRIHRITEPFVQGDPHVSRRRQGIGLGLHIVRLLSELHGAALLIESVEGEGTAVHVEFPAERIVRGAATA